MRGGRRCGGQVDLLESRVLLSDWYVSTTGNDLSAGTLASPWRTIQHAVDTAASSDSVYLRGGTYTEALWIRKSGLTISGYGQETAQITTPTDTIIEVTIRIGEDASYTRLTNLDISGGSYYAVKTESTWDTGVLDPHGPSYVTIENCRLHDSGADVLKLTPATNYATIRNNEIYNSGKRNPANAEGIDAVQANYASVSGNYIHDIATNGVYFKGGSVGMMFERNRIAHTGFSGILLGQNTDTEWFDVRVNPDYYENIDGIVRNNIIWDTQGAGIGAWAALRPQIYNNTLYNVAKTWFGGLLIQGQEHWIPNEVLAPSRDVAMYNNIVNVFGERPALEIRAGGIAGTLTLSNNCYDQGLPPVTIRDLTRAFEGTLAQWQALGMDANSLDADPVLDLLDFSIPASSPAVDHGITSPVTTDFYGTNRPIGAAYDIGAYEYQPSGAALTTPVDFSATVTGAHTIGLAWTNTAADASGILLEQATDPEFRFDVASRSLPATATTLALSGLLSNVRYYFRLRATRGDAMSLAATANATTAVSAANPAMPSIAAVLWASNRGVSLTWSYPAPGTTGGAASGFIIERTRTSGGITYYQRYTSAVTSFVDTSVEPDVTYEYRIRAANDSGWSNATNPVQATTTTVQNQPPQIVSPAAATPAIVTDSTTNLSVLGADDGGEANLRYGWSILAKPSDAADPTFTGNGTNAAKNTVVTFGMVGSYLLRAYVLDSSNLFATSDLAITVIGATSPIPQPPLNPTAASAGPNQVYLAWQMPLPIPLSYTLQRSSTPDFSQDLTTVRIAGGTTVYPWSGLLSNMPCYFRLASNLNGLTSAWSYASTTTMSLPVTPYAPTSVVATRISSWQVSLSWSMPAPNIYGNGQTGFLIERSPLQDFSTGVIRLRVAGADTRTFVDPKVKPGTVYYYRIRAINSWGWSDPSATAPAAATMGAQTILNRARIALATWDPALLA